MKCRKCGYVIPISQVPPAPPTVHPPGGDALPPVPRPPLAPRGLEPPPSSRSAPRPPSSSPAPRTALGKLATSPGRPAPLRPAATPPVVAKVPPKVDVRPPPRASSELLPAIEDDVEEQPTTIASGGALAAAFGALVTAPRDSKATSDQAMHGDEWYVGINDVPVGPIRLGELRAKAASGAIQGDSLVWRDGLEDWRPLRTFPELVAVVEESLSNVRASGAPLVPLGNGAARAAYADFGTPLPSGVTSVGVVTDDLALAGLTRTKTPVAAWIAIAVALACGALGAYVVIKRKPPEVVIKYVDRPVPGAEQPAAVGAQVPGAEVAPGADSAGGKPRTGSRTGGKAVTATTNGDKGGGLSGLKGLDGLRPGGPGPGTAPGTTTPSSGGGQLDAAQTQAVVARYTGSVKRSCWQPALDARDPSAPTTARVQVAITVGPNGNVTNATTNGDPRGYPGLSSCIAGRVRGWQFPATGSTTTVNVPFVFAAQ